MIPANNYIQLPKTGSQSLGLTGRYVYLTFKVIPERYFVVHLDVASADGLVIRYGFCNRLPLYACSREIHVFVYT